MNYKEKLEKIYERLKLTLGTLTAYTLFKLALSRIPVEISNQVILTENDVRILTDNMEDYKVYLEAIKEVLLASLGDTIVQMVVGDLWK